MDALLAFELIKPGLGMAAGAGLLWFPARHRRAAERRHNIRLAQLHAGREEAFFEERRSLEAYKPARKDWIWQLFGAVLFVGSAYEFYRFVTT